MLVNLTIPGQNGADVSGGGGGGGGGAAVPTLSEWGLIALGAVIISMGVASVRRKAK
jgi:hypothetical protein